MSTILTDALPTTSWFAPRSPLVAVGTDAGLVTVWDISNPKEPQEIRRFTDSPDENTLVAAGGDEVFFGWDLTSKSPDATFILQPHMGATIEGRFLFDGSVFVGTGDDDGGGVRMWTLEADAARPSLCTFRGAPLTTVEWTRFLPGVTPFEPG